MQENSFKLAATPLTRLIEDRLGPRPVRRKKDLHRISRHFVDLGLGESVDFAEEDLVLRRGQYQPILMGSMPSRNPDSEQTSAD